MKKEHTIEMVSDGNLAFCTTCKGGEGSLTTECCGRPITQEEEHKIYNLGTLDFINGKWLIKTCRNCKKHAGNYIGNGCFHAHTDDTICKSGWVAK